MKTIKMQDMAIPAIALGTWSWGTGATGGDEVFGNYLNEKDLQPVFDTAMNAGFNLWDTAAVYGMNASETILGNFIKENNDVIISTKFTPQIAGDNDEAMEDLLNESLQRLGTDAIDIYWIHNPADVKRWTPKLIPLLKSGKVKKVGVSNHNLEEIKLANRILAEEGFRISAVQNHYSLLYRSSEEAGIIDYCKENGIAFFSYMVLEQGALTNKYGPNSPLPSGTRRGEAFTPEVLTKIESLIQVIAEVGQTKNASVAQIATAWAIAKGTVPIVGATKIAHVEDAIGASEINLTEQEVQLLEKAAKETNVVIKGDWENPMN